LIKKIFISLLFASLIVPSVSSASSVPASFTDVTKNYWAYHSIQLLVKEEIIRGYADGNFRPGEPITRKQAALMMARTLNLEEVPGKEIEIEDISPNESGYEEMKVSVDNELFDLWEGMFFPNFKLTRGDMAKALVEGFQLKGSENVSFTDVPKESYYYDYVATLIANDVTTGYNDGTFRLHEPVTRAQFSAFIARVINKPLEYEVKQSGTTLSQFSNKEEAINFALSKGNATIQPKKQFYSTHSDYFLDPQRSGINKGVLLYNGYEVDGNELYSGLSSPEFFEPYIAYKKNGQYIDSMFDTLIILGREYPNGSFAETPNNRANYSEWQWYIDKTVGPNGTVDMINQSVENIPNVDEVDVYLTIPYPKRSEAITDLYGETTEKGLEARLNMVKWYVEEIIDQFNQGDYNGVNVKGFYWLNETVTNPEDEQLVSMVSEYLRWLDFKFIYSPHALSTNYDYWKENGFDGAFLQVNAHKMHFTNTEVQKRLHDAFLSAQMRGSGINLEIENHGPTTALQGFENFRTYLRYADMYGLQDKSVIMYQGVSMIHRLATYEDKEYNALYDEIYQFIKNK